LKKGGVWTGEAFDSFVGSSLSSNEPMVISSSGVDFKVEFAGRRPGDPPTSWRLANVPAQRSDGSRNSTICKSSSRMRWHGSADLRAQQLKSSRFADSA
jgi:hypothetical protein